MDFANPCFKTAPGVVSRTPATVPDLSQLWGKKNWRSSKAASSPIISTEFPAAEATVPDLSRLSGIILAVVKGGVADRYFHRNHQEIKLSSFDSPGKAFDALTEGDAAAPASDVIEALPPH
ncbi:MAG: transporter substrate-binding domain-containing protein [Deltaproteobacteria bacterium]|nr:transporter substrate-binding domain-containing protein [Deltaproteobacteria bacterium]